MTTPSLHTPYADTPLSQPQGVNTPTPPFFSRFTMLPPPPTSTITTGTNGGTARPPTMFSLNTIPRGLPHNISPQYPFPPPEPQGYPATTTTTMAQQPPTVWPPMFESARQGRPPPFTFGGGSGGGMALPPPIPMTMALHDGIAVTGESRG